MITQDQFDRLYPNAKNSSDIVKSLCTLLPKYDIITPKRIAAFISQCGHESGGWRVFEENLNYSAAALNIVFPKYFKNAGRDSNDYARQPEKIANIIYCNRMGNGDSLSGDGWLFRGRGSIQITGRDNYASFSYAEDVKALTDPDIVANEMDMAILSALWYWSTHGLNDYADDGDIKTLTRKINGGFNGLSDRLSHYNSVLNEIDSDQDGILDIDDSNEPDEMHHEVFGMLRRGSRGEGVELVQQALGLTSDGIFGKGTERAVMNWQKNHGLVADGIVGPKTLDKMLD